MLQIFISDQYQRSFESQKVTINSSQQSEALADFSQSSNSTYQTSTDGMESCLLQGSAERPKSHSESQSVDEVTDKPAREIVWIDYHPPPKDGKRNIHNL